MEANAGKLRWLKPVSTLQKNVLITRIDTTTLNSNVMVPYQRPIIAEIDSVIFVTGKVTVATGEPCKHAPYFRFNCSYLQNEVGDPQFLFLKCNQHARIKLSAKFKKIKCTGLGDTLNN